MYRIGVDIGSTYTKYCVLNTDSFEQTLFMEKTEAYQRDYFSKKVMELKLKYPDAEIISCGYGRENISSLKTINELSALAIGVNSRYPEFETALDIGGQDSKVILQKDGKLQQFYLNDRCAAGSGMFLLNTLNYLGVEYLDIDLANVHVDSIRLSSVCAVFAQSEVVRLVADNNLPNDIIYAVLWHILAQSKKLIDKVDSRQVLLTGGMTNISGIDRICEKVLGVRCSIAEDGSYLAAIGCAHSVN